MTTKQLLIAVTTAVVITPVFGGSAAGQTKTDLPVKAADIPFLTPLPSRFVISSDDPLQPRSCRTLQGSATCLPTLVYGGGASGWLPTIDPAFKAHLPNVRVSMVLQEITNEIVANGGVEGSDGIHNHARVEFTTNGEPVPPFTLYQLPGPGAPPASYAEVIYDTLLFNQCDSFTSFSPVSHSVWMYANLESFVILGQFAGFDSGTIDALGFYNFNYTIRAEASDGGVSDFHFSGKVNVLCSAANSL